MKRKESNLCTFTNTNLYSKNCFSQIYSHNPCRSSHRICFPVLLQLTLIFKIIQNEPQRLTRVVKTYKTLYTETNLKGEESKEHKHSRYTLLMFDACETKSDVQDINYHI